MTFKKKEIQIFIFTFIVGLVAHFFIIANPLFNADGIFYNRSMGAGSIIGRWLIEILNMLLNLVGYNTVIPMLNVVVAILIISFSSIYLIRILDIHKDIYKYIISCALVLSPCLVQTFFYGFTAHIYALAILFTILSVYEMVVKDQVVLSIILNCLALALYQAYVPFMLCIYLVVFIKMLINENIMHCLKELVKYIVSFIISFLMYYMLNAIVNRKYDGYIWPVHGMSERFVPKFTIDSLINDVKVAYQATVDIVIKHNVFAHNTTLFIRVIYLIIIILSIVLLILFIKRYLFDKVLYKNERKKNFIKVIFIVLLFLLLPLAINFIFVMTNNGITYVDDRLSFSYVFYIIVPIFMLWLIISKEKTNKVFSFALEKIVLVVCIIVLLHNIWLAYGSYYNQYKIINASKSFAVELATTIKMLPGYDNDTKVLFIGSPYAKSSHFNYGYYVDAEHNLYSNFDVEYENILSEYPMIQVFKEFTALDFKEPEADLASNLYYSDEIKKMPLYPKDGSVKMIEDIAVVKFKEPII